METFTEQNPRGMCMEDSVMLHIGCQFFHLEKGVSNPKIYCSHPCMQIDFPKLDDVNVLVQKYTEEAKQRQEKLIKGITTRREMKEPQPNKLDEELALIESTLAEMIPGIPGTEPTQPLDPMSLPLEQMVSESFLKESEGGSEEADVENDWENILWSVF